MKTSDDFSAAEEKSIVSSNKLKIYSKSNLDLKDFFTKILPEIVNYILGFYKESNS